MALIGTLISFANGAVIQASDFNTNFQAFKDAFNTSAVLTDVAKTVSVGHTFAAAQTFSLSNVYTVPQLMPDGAVGAPTFSFVSDPTTGMYRSAASTLAFAAAGGLKVTIGSLGTTILAGQFFATAVTCNLGGITKVGVGGAAGESGNLQINSGATATPTITFLRNSSARAAINFETVAGATITSSAVDDLLIRSQGRLVFVTNGYFGSIKGWIDSSSMTIAVPLVIPTSTPATAAAAGTAGQIAWDASYIYVATGTNTWKRAAIATW